MELFDFELEVRPILEVLVGRTLTLSVYELLEEEEKREYAAQAKLIAQRKEYELINLQKEEAARNRRNQEIERRNIQKMERITHEKISQKKILSKFFAKQYVSTLKSDALKHLKESGNFNFRTKVKLNEFVTKSMLPQCSKVDSYLNCRESIYTQLESSFANRELAKHKILLGQVFDDRKTEKQNKEKEEIEKKLEAERALREKLRLKEEKRVEKYTKVINETILKTKFDKVDISSCPLADLDEFSLVGGAIHTIGGQFGELIIALQSLHDSLVVKYNEISPNLNINEFILAVFSKYLLSLKENQFFNIKYLESQRFDFSAIPDDELKRKEFKEFLLDEKRFYNKSAKILINNGYLSKQIYDGLISAVAETYFKQPVDTNSPEIQAKMNPEPDNQDETYLKKVKAKIEEINSQNQIIDKLKKKIKIQFIKPEVLKKKKANIVSLITVNPVEDTFETYTEEIVEEVTVAPIPEPEQKQIEVKAPPQDNDMDNMDQDGEPQMTNDDKNKDEPLSEAGILYIN